MNIKESFVKFYFEAESRADIGFYQESKTFLLKDKIKICEHVEQLLNTSAFLGCSGIAKYLAKYDENRYSEDRLVTSSRHQYRLTSWFKAYKNGQLRMDNAVSVSSQGTDVSILKKNLVESITAVCCSAIKNGLNDDDIKIILNSGHITAKEQHKIKQVKQEFEKFMRTNGLTKDLVAQMIGS